MNSSSSSEAESEERKAGRMLSLRLLRLLWDTLRRHCGEMQLGREFEVHSGVGGWVKRTVRDFCGIQLD